MPDKPEKPRGRRITVDLTPSATIELDKLKQLTDLSTTEIFRFALWFFRKYVLVKEQDGTMLVREGDRETEIELPIMLRRQENPRGRTDARAHSAR